MGDVNAGLADLYHPPPTLHRVGARLRRVRSPIDVRALYRVGAAPRAALAACASASRRPLARVGCHCIEVGLPPRAALAASISRALPAGRGKASPCTPTQGGRGEATPLPFYAPTFPLFHRSSAPICTFARAPPLLRTPSSVLCNLISPLHLSTGRRPIRTFAPFCASCPLASYARAYFFFPVLPLRRPFLPMPKGDIFPCWTFWKRLFEFVTPRQ